MRLAYPLMRALGATAVLAALTVTVVVTAMPGSAATAPEATARTCQPPEASTGAASGGGASAGMGVGDWRGLVPAGLGSMMR
jgi:hypothetical protein